MFFLNIFSSLLVSVRVPFSGYSDPRIPGLNEKEGMGCEEKAAKKRETQKRKNFLEKTIGKICGEKKILREEQTLLPGIL